MDGRLVDGRERDFFDGDCIVENLPFVGLLTYFECDFVGGTVDRLVPVTDLVVVTGFEEGILEIVNGDGGVFVRLILIVLLVVIGVQDFADDTVYLILISVCRGRERETSIDFVRIQCVLFVSLLIVVNLVLVDLVVEA